jgi:hypothetical protein
MTSKIPFSQFLDFKFATLALRPRTLVSVVEYNRHGGVYDHFSGTLMNHDYSSRPWELLSLTIHGGEANDWDGFPARHEVKRFSLSAEYYSTSFETAGVNGSVGILHGFCRDGRFPVDIFISGEIREL